MMTEPEVRDLRKRIIECARIDAQNGLSQYLPGAIAAANALSIVLKDQPTGEIEIYDRKRL